VIAWYAVLYGSFILIYGLLGFYWWTVVRRWADCLLDNSHMKPAEDPPSYPNLNVSLESDGRKP